MKDLLFTHKLSRTEFVYAGHNGHMASCHVFLQSSSFSWRRCFCFLKIERGRLRSLSYFIVFPFLFFFLRRGFAATAFSALCFKRNPFPCFSFLFLFLVFQCCRFSHVCFISGALSKELGSFRHKTDWWPSWHPKIPVLQTSGYCRKAKVLRSLPLESFS